MSTEVTCTPARSTRWLRCVAWGALLALLAAEVLLLTIRFDTGTLGAETGWWTVPFNAAPSLLRFGLVTAAATLLFGGADLWDELWRKGDVFVRPARRGAFLAGHFAALALFTWVTAVALEGDLAHTSGFPGAWVGAWVATGAATLALWGLACLPADVLLRLLKRCWKALLLGGAAGAVALGAGAAADLLWRPLGRWTLVIVHALLRLVFPGTVCDTANFEVGTDVFTVQIAPECSGYEGMGLMAVFLWVYLWLFRHRHRFPAALLLLPIGVATVWLLNSVRIAALIAIGTWGWSEVALGGFHSQAGWLAFIAVAFGLVALAGHVRWFAAAPAPAAAASPTFAYLAPFAAVLTAAMVGSAFAGEFDWLYPLRVVAGAVALWLFRRSYAELRGPCSWQAVAIGMATGGVWLALVPQEARDGSGLPAALVAASPVWVALWLGFRVVGHVVTVPLAEELAFRGYLIRRLTAADFLAVPPARFSWLAFALSSALFGALHGRAWLAGTVAAMAFALAQRRSGRLIDAVVAHATANALVAACGLATGRWSPWS